MPTLAYKALYAEVEFFRPRPASATEQLERNVVLLIDFENLVL